MDKNKISVIQRFAQEVYDNLLKLYPEKSDYTLEHNFHYLCGVDMLVCSVIWDDDRCLFQFFDYTIENFNAIKDGGFPCE